MASTVLPNGIIIPEKFSRDWYADLYHNWQELDNLLGGGTPKDGTLTIQKNGDTVGTFSANQATNETINIEVPTKTSDLNNDSGFITGVAWDDVTNKPSFATVATSGSYTDLSDKPTIPTVNNATLTIQKNGTDVATFSANSSTNATANITVPTKTSDLTNDSGFITEDTTKIPLAGSNQISGSLIPATTDAYDLGSSSYQWNNAYIKALTINGVACGDILTHNASEFVDVNTAQNIRGLKSFYDVGRYYIDIGTKNTNFLSFKVLNIELDSETNLPTKGYTFSQNITSANPVLYLGNYYSVTTQGLVGTDIRNYKYGSNKDYAGISIRYDLNDDSYIQVKCNRFVPNVNNATVLGSTAYKWADVNTNLINGINPGALSLPSSTYIDVDTTNWILDGSNVNSFTPTSDGWLGIQVTDTVYDQMHYVFIGRTGDGNTYYQQNVLSPINALWDDEYHGCVFIPVIKNVGYDIRCICSTIVVTFYPCQGNV